MDARSSMHAEEMDGLNVQMPEFSIWPFKSVFIDHLLRLWLFFSCKKESSIRLHNIVLLASCPTFESYNMATLHAYQNLLISNLAYIFYWCIKHNLSFHNHWHLSFIEKVGNFICVRPLWLFVSRVVSLDKVFNPFWNANTNLPNKNLNIFFYFWKSCWKT
jgi:hypothetical protein